MTRIPAPALLLGLAGLLPFLWGAATHALPALMQLSLSTLGPSFSGAPVLITYGTIILSFMAGVIWGFAAKAGGPWLATGLALSVLPALWAFFTVSPLAETRSLIALIVGFVGLLAIDRLCAQRGFAPDWWMPLRLLLTTVVTLCLLIGAIL